MTGNGPVAEGAAFTLTLVASDPGADTDKNQTLTGLEAYKYARTKTKEYFDTQKRLATEHSVLEDTGKGDGEQYPSVANGEGLLAGRFPLLHLGFQTLLAFEELGEIWQPLLLAGGDLIEAGFHPGRETGVHQVREVLLQQGGHGEGREAGDE